MKLKRNVVLGIMSIILVFGTIVAYAADEARNYGYYYPNGKGTYPVVEAYAYMNDSGWGRHTGKATGSLYGTDKEAAGNYRVEAYYGKYEPTKTAHAKGYIGLTNGKYSVILSKVGWYTELNCDIYKQGNTTDILAHASVTH